MARGPSEKQNTSTTHVFTTCAATILVPLEGCGLVIGNNAADALKTNTCTHAARTHTQRQCLRMFILAIDMSVHFHRSAVYRGRRYKENHARTHTHTCGRLASLALLLISASRASSLSQRLTVSAILVGSLLNDPKPPSVTKGTLPACVGCQGAQHTRMRRTGRPECAAVRFAARIHRQCKSEKTISSSQKLSSVRPSSRVRHPAGAFTCTERCRREQMRPKRIRCKHNNNNDSDSTSNNNATTRPPQRNL